MNNRSLFLGSQSASRQRLLNDAQIPFQIIGHHFDEASCDTASLSLQDIVQKIARSKMEHVHIPLEGVVGQVCFILTADTLCLTDDGILLGKPVDKTDAIEKLRAGRKGARCATAFCLDKRVYTFDGWHNRKRIEKVVQSDYFFDVPDHWIDRYLSLSSGLKASGAIAIEDFGSQFLRDVRGSYSTIIGLPMFELREALEEIGFFDWLAQDKK